MLSLAKLIAGKIQAAGGRALIVGGYVRDMVMSVKSKDLDLEVYGLEPDAVARELEKLGSVDAVGRAFGVFKLRVGDQEVDVSLPRRESKSGQGHRGFVTTPAPDMSVIEAASRRDFTMNAMAYDPLTHDLIDPADGRADIYQGVLRAVGPAFAEDPLRVLRGMQFAARFGMRMTPTTAETCREMLDQYRDLPVERVWGEWSKFLALGKYPAMGLRVLVDTGWIAPYPELSAMIGCQQHPIHHPEGDVWRHTMAVLTEAFGATHGHDEGTRMLIRLAAACHDMGKPIATCRRDLSAHGHAGAGAAPTLTFCTRIGAPSWLRERVLPLVREHMVREDSLTPRAIRRLALRLLPATVRELAELVRADRAGRDVSVTDPTDRFHLNLVAAAELVASDEGAPTPLIMGRDLLALGLKPGRMFGEILDIVYEAQLDGLVATQAQARGAAAAVACRMGLLEPPQADEGAVKGQ